MPNYTAFQLVDGSPYASLVGSRDFACDRPLVYDLGVMYTSATIRE
jgi:hypothetical protein